MYVYNLLSFFADIINSIRILYLPPGKSTNPTAAEAQTNILVFQSLQSSLSFLIVSFGNTR